MDTTLIVLMLAACICGNYKNSANQPPPFRGNLAKDEAESKYFKEPSLPNYTKSYGSIITGDGYLLYRKSIFIIFNRPLDVKDQSKQKHCNYRVTTNDNRH